MGIQPNFIKRSEMISKIKTTGSDWKQWHILVAFPGQPLRHISETVLARSKEEAETKAGKFLSGRGTILYKVRLP